MSKGRDLRSWDERGIKGMDAVLIKSNHSIFRELWHQLRISGVLALVGLGIELGFLWTLAHFAGVSAVGQWFLALALALPVFVWATLPKTLSFHQNNLIVHGFLSLQALLFGSLLLVFMGLKFALGFSWSSFGVAALALTWVALREFAPGWKHHAKDLRHPVALASRLKFKTMVWQIWRQNGLRYAQNALEWLILLLPVYALGLHGGWEALGYFAVLSFWLCTHRVWIHPERLPGKEGLTLCLQEKNLEGFERLFLRQLSYGLLAWLVVLVMVSLLGEALLGWSFGFTYGRYGEVLTWMVAAGGLWILQAYLRQGRLLLESAKHPLADTVFWVGLQFLLVWAMVPHLGLSGAAWSLFLVALLRSLTQVIRLERALKRWPFESSGPSVRGA